MVELAASVFLSRTWGFCSVDTRGRFLRWSTSILKSYAEMLQHWTPMTYSTDFCVVSQFFVLITLGFEGGTFRS